MIKRILMLFSMALTSMVEAISPSNIPDENDKLRITELMPHFYVGFAVEPAVPTNFVAMTPSGTFNVYDWVYWGPKDVLESYFKNPSSLNEPILKVKISSNVKQTGPKEFGENTKELLNDFKKAFSNVSLTEKEWGFYPVIEIKATALDQKLFMAWVGLNDVDSGSTLVINLVYPEKKGSPSQKDLKFWNNFITQTKQLVGRELYKAYGQDMHLGYTNVNRYGAHLKMTAEKRKRDGTIQVVIQPGENVTFAYKELGEGLLGGDWNAGAPLVKVYGAINYSSKERKTIIDHTTSILIETVDEFSVDKAKPPKGVFVFQKES